jgi:hypothetical protein
VTTLSALADRAQTAMNDAAAGTWPQATIEEWLNEAIRDYSLHFPRLQSTTLNCVAGQHNYTLPADFLAVHLVEYPVGEDPPEYLARGSRARQDFWDAEGYYDVEVSGEATAGTLWISEDPTVGETIELSYLATHDHALAANGTLTVPGHHEHLLILFVVWRAWTERQATEQADPDHTSTVLDAHRRSTDSAEAIYRRAVKLAKTGASPSGYTGPWAADPYDRIY